MKSLPCVATFYLRNVRKVAGELDMSGRAACTALRHNVTGTTFALSTLGGNTQFKLNLVKAHASTCVTDNFAVRDSVADADDHGGLAC